MGGHSFEPACGIGCFCLGKGGEDAGERGGGGIEFFAVGGVGGFACGAEEGVACVVDFSGDEAAGDGEGFFGGIGCAELGAAEGDAGVGDSCDAGAEASVFVEVVDGDGVLEGELHGSVGEDDFVAHDADAFDMVDGEGEDAFFFPFDDEGQVVALDEKAWRGEV